MANSNLEQETPINSWIRQVTGKESHWTNLDEIAADPDAKESLKTAILNRFPTHFLSRREFMEWTGGLMAVLGLSSCTRQPQEKILPYVKTPEGVLPGTANYFASAYAHDGGGIGLLVESHTGRPTKIEGNPDHPGSLGSTDGFAQAAILDLYDPDRLQELTRDKVTSTWAGFQQELNAALGGGNLRIVSETVVSPTLGAQLRELLAKFPKAKWIRHDGVSRANVRDGAKMAFGENVQTVYRLDSANVVVSLDSDFLNAGPGSVRYSRDFASRRSAASGQSKFSRFYAFECTPTVTGSVADHLWPVRPSLVPAVTAALAKALGVESPAAAGLSEDLGRIVTAIAKDLQANSGASLVVPGEYQPAEVHALCHAINAKLGNVGKTLVYTAPIDETPAEAPGLSELVADLNAGQVDVLAVFGGNPLFSGAAELDLPTAFSKAKLSFHVTAFVNETSVKCRWNIPETHFLEQWNDVKAYDGTVSIAQPLIAPLYSGKSQIEVAALLLGRTGSTSYQEVKKRWNLAEGAWNRAVHDGVVAGSSAAEKRVSLKAGAVKALPTLAEGMQVVLRPDPTIWDGRFANNPWLQELPKPISKLTWDNAVYVAPSTGLKQGLKNGQVVRVVVNGRQVEGPVWMLPGQPEETLTLHLGYGRKVCGRIGTGTGFDAYPLVDKSGAWHLGGARVEKSAKHVELACTQGHFKVEGRDLIRAGSVAEYKKTPSNFAPEATQHAMHTAHEIADSTALPQGRPFEDERHAWGMAIDMSVCNGCSACVVACTAENNVSTVGKDQVLRYREMHWIRIDRYYEGPPENPTVSQQPVPCMHCETAPCTVVCPVAATTISPEGINEMTYNRCVGTKYCSNNCPYKVRRFNFYQYADIETPVIQLARNPDVTVRARGVMEKCTYCVQRVNQARIVAKRENRSVKDGEITPACAAACPSQAITFGNVKDPKSRVAQLKALPLNYGLLAELGTRPRTTYLAKLRNPNTEIGADLARKSF